MESVLVGVCFYGFALFCHAPVSGTVAFTPQQSAVYQLTPDQTRVAKGVPAVADVIDLMLCLFGARFKLPCQVIQNSAFGAMLLWELDDPPLIIKELADPDHIRHVTFPHFHLTAAFLSTALEAAQFHQRIL